MKNLQKISTRFFIPLLMGIGLVLGSYELKFSLVSNNKINSSVAENTGLTSEKTQISQTIKSRVLPQILQQKYSNLDVLYQQAAIADIELQNIAKKWANITEGTVVLPPGGLKGRRRAEEKIKMDYEGDASKITDLARISIEYDSLEQLYFALQAIPETVKLVRIKDRFIQPTPGGYRDILLNVKLSNQHIAEVQLNLKSINQVRFGKGYQLYQQIRQIQVNAMNENRELSLAEQQEIEKLNQESQKLYDAALYSVNP
ncbi:MAG: hypothetical protein WBA77_18640 [Microcoleaceae cyanobacterium]